MWEAFIASEPPWLVQACIVLGVFILDVFREAILAVMLRRPMVMHRRRTPLDVRVDARRWQEELDARSWQKVLREAAKEEWLYRIVPALPYLVYPHEATAGLAIVGTLTVAVPWFAQIHHGRHRLLWECLLFEGVGGFFYSCIFLYGVFHGRPIIAAFVVVAMHFMWNIRGVDWSTRVMKKIIAWRVHLAS